MNLPIPEYGKTDKDTINNLMDTVVKLRKELEYVLYHLDEKNIPMMKSVVGDIDGVYTAIEQNENQISLLATDLNGAKAQITVQAGQISSLVTTTQGQQTQINQTAQNITLLASTVDGHTAQISVQANQISQKVSYNGVISAINQSAEQIDIDAQRINLYGITAVNDVLQIGYTNTNGEIRFKARNSGGPSAYVRLYTSGLYEADDLNIDCSTLNVRGNQYIEYGLAVSGSAQIDDMLIINNYGGTAISSYGNVDFWGGYVRVGGSNVSVEGHSHSEYVKTMSSQNLRLQVFGSGLEVWNGSSYLGKAVLT